MLPSRINNKLVQIFLLIYVISNVQSSDHIFRLHHGTFFSKVSTWNLANQYIELIIERPLWINSLPQGFLYRPCSDFQKKSPETIQNSANITTTATPSTTRGKRSLAIVEAITRLVDPPPPRRTYGDFLRSSSRDPHLTIISNSTGTPSILKWNADTGDYMWVPHTKPNATNEEKAYETKCTIYNSGALLFNKFISTFHQEIFDLISQLNHSDHNIEQHQHPHRTKRSWSSFWGNLFDLTQQDDFNSLKEKVDLMRVQKDIQFNSLVEKHNNLSQYVNILDKKVDASIAAIYEINENLQNLFNYENGLFIETSIWERGLTTLAMNFTTAMIHLNRLRSALAHLEQGKLTSDLIPPADLQEAVTHVQNKLRTNELAYPYSLDINVPLFYSQTQHIKFLYNTTGNIPTIILFLRLPLTTPTSLYKLYFVQTFPVPFPNGTHHSKLMLSEPYFGVDRTNNSYFTLSAGLYSLCSQYSGPTCPHLPVPVPRHTTPHCLMSLFTGDFSDISEVCDYRFQPGSLPPSVFQLTPSTLLATNIKTVTETCPKNTVQSSTKFACTQCQIPLNCHCALQLDNFSIPPRITDCNGNATAPFYVKYFPNLAVIGQYFSPDLIQKYLNETSSLWNVQIPNVTLSDATLRQLQSFNQYHLKLNDVIAATKQNKAIDSLLNSLPDGVTSDLWSLLNDSTSTRLFAGTGTFSIIFLLASFIYTCYLHRRLNKLAKSVLLTTQFLQMRPVHSLPIIGSPSTPAVLSWSSATTTTTLSPISHAFSNTHECYALTVSLSLLAVFAASVLMALIIIIFFYCKNLRALRSNICLEISTPTNPTNPLLIPIGSLPTHPSMLRINPFNSTAWPRYLTLNRDRFGIILDVDWENITIYDPFAKTTLTPPRTFRLPWEKVAHLAESIMEQDDYITTLICDTHHCRFYATNTSRAFLPHRAVIPAPPRRAGNRVQASSPPAYPQVMETVQ